MRPGDTEELSSIVKLPQNTGRVLHGSPRETADPVTWPTRAFMSAARRTGPNSFQKPLLRPWPHPPGPPRSSPVRDHPFGGDGQVDQERCASCLIVRARVCP